MDGQNEIGFIFGDHFDPNNVVMRERDDSESDTISMEVFAVGGSQSNATTSKGRSRKRPFNRHTPEQVKGLENYFNSCAHPDEKQRLEIGRRLGLQSRQVKFWFQNRRTQMKSQIERHENESLKQEYDKLLDENIALKKLISNPICQNCGGPAILGEVSFEDQQIRIENARLKDELIRVSTIAEKFIGKPISDLVNQITTTSPNSVSNLSTGRIGVNGIVGPNFENGVSSNSPMNGAIMTNDFEKTVFMQAGVAAMDELLALAERDSPLWFKGIDGREILNIEEYTRKFSPSTSVRPSSLVTDATRETSSVFISSSELVETMMSPRRWKDMFPCLVGKTSTIEILYIGKNGTQDGELQLINAEFLFPSPFVPLRQEKFLRFSKQRSQGMWAVVDVSLDTLREPSYTSPYIKGRRLPSGCIIQDVANGYSLVTWIEHSEYDENGIHQLYRPLLSSGLAFGAQRWLATLQRERESAAILMPSRISPEPNEGDFPQGRKRSIIELMKRISNNLSLSLCGSSLRRWQKLEIEGLDADVSIMSRVNVGQPGEPSGLVLSASTSVWMPIPRQQLFSFIRDEQQRGKWDVLASGGPMKIISSLPKSHDGTNVILLLCPPAAPPRESNMLILQESWSDKTGSFMVYAPVDSTSMESILKGADADYLALLPSGFSITDGPIHPNATTLTLNKEGSNSSGASVFTMGFQILLSSNPATKLNAESIETVKKLMSCTITKIRASLGIN